MGMSIKKKINVYVVHKDVMDEENYIFNKVYISIWNKIKKALNHKYIFIEKKVAPEYKKYLKELSENGYDILISGLNITQERLLDNYFTTPIYVTRPCVLYPLIAINYQDFLTYLKFYSKIWIKPFITIIVFFVLISILDIILFKNINLKRLLNTNSILIGNLGYLNMIKKNSTYIKLFLIALIHLFLMHFIFSYTTAISVKFINAYDSMDISIKNRKIFLPEGSIQDYRLVKNSGGIPVIISQQKIKQFGGIEQYYLHNKNKADGVFMGFLSKKAERLLYSNQLKKSNYYFGSYYNGYAINKKNKELLIDINEEIHKLKINGDIKIECERNDVPSDIVIR